MIPRTGPNKSVLGLMVILGIVSDRSVKKLLLLVLRISLSAIGFFTFGVGGWLGVRLIRTEDSLAYVTRDARLCLDRPLMGLKWYYESFVLLLDVYIRKSFAILGSCLG